MAVTISQIQAGVQKLTDDQLVQEIKNPTGVAPLSLLAQEAQKRAMMRRQMRKGPQGFADGGAVDDGGGMPTDWQGIARYASDPNNFINQGIQNPGLQAIYGINGPRQSLQDFVAQAGQLMPDRSTGVFDQMVGQLQGDLDENHRDNRGRALMQMGLAMMQSHDPSLMGALGAGGQAALDTRDKIRAQQSGLMAQVMQARMAQAQAQAQHDAALMNAGVTLNSDQNQRYGQYGNAIMQNAQMGQHAALTGAQLQQSAQEAAANRANQTALAAMAENAAAGRQAQMIAAENQRALWGQGIGIPGGRQASPEQAQSFMQQAQQDVYMRLGAMKTNEKGNPVIDTAKIQHLPTDTNEIVVFNATQRMINAGLQPPKPMMDTYKSVLPRIQAAQGRAATTIPQAASAAKATGIARGNNQDITSIAQARALLGR